MITTARVFHEKTLGCHYKFDNYLLILLNNIIIQQVIDIFFCNQINCFPHYWEKIFQFFVRQLIFSKLYKTVHGH